MDEYLIYGDSIRKIAGEARRLAYSEADMDPAEIYEALRKVSPGESTPSSDGVAFSSEQIDPDKDYKVNYNFMAQVVYHVQRMIGSKENMTKEQIIEGLSEILFIPQARIRVVVDLLFYGTTITAWLPDYQNECAGTLVEQIEYDTSTSVLQVTRVLSKAHLINWTCNNRYVAAGDRGVQSRTSWVYESAEQSVDSGRMTAVKGITNDLTSVEEVTVV